jgi:streptomycin 6-kinase
MTPTIPAVLRHAVADEPSGAAWLGSLPELVARAAQRWELVVGEPFDSGMAAWTAPATTSTGADVVLKLSFPHDEARSEAAALVAWGGSGAVELLEADEADQALLLRRVRPGTRLVDASLAVEEHLLAGADVLRRLGTVDVAPGPFPDLVAVADELADATDERVARLVPGAPYPVDRGLARHGVGLLRSLSAGADRVGLAHGDLNPGNVLRSDVAGWLAIDPKPVWGDLAWDPWPLLTQVDDWVDVVPDPADLVARTRLVSDVVDLDPARVASWCTARSLASGWWAADRGWWTGFRGADGDLARATAWARAAHLLGA